MKIKELENILLCTPSVSGNTFGVVALMILAGILGGTCLILGLGLMLESWLGYQIFLNSITSGIGVTVPDDRRASVAMMFGLICLILAVIFLGVWRICKMVLRRNQFIIDLEDWIEANISPVPNKSGRRKPDKK